MKLEATLAVVVVGTTAAGGVVVMAVAVTVGAAVVEAVVVTAAIANGSRAAADALDDAYRATAEVTIFVITESKAGDGDCGDRRSDNCGTTATVTTSADHGAFSLVIIAVEVVTEVVIWEAGVGIAVIAAGAVIK